MALITIPTRTSADLNAAADINALMDNDEYLEAEIPNAAWPVGSFYWQPPSAESNTKATAFPTAEEPGELFGGTWEQKYNDEGLFFKTEGDVLSQTDGENNARTDGLQTDDYKAHTHSNAIPLYYYDASGPRNYPRGSYPASYQADWSWNTGTSPASNGNETRGRNRLLKLWYRTA